MRRLICLFVLLPGLLQQAWAQQPPAADTISTYLTQRFGVAKAKAVQISAAVTSAAEKYSLPPAVLLAIISIESRFRERARGANGATGLMQIVPSAHRNLLHNVKNLTSPDVNIDVGSSILYGYRRAAGGDLNTAMKNYGGSSTYVEKIESRAAEFASLFKSAQAGPNVERASTVVAAADANADASAITASAVPATPEVTAIPTAGHGAN